MTTDYKHRHPIYPAHITRSAHDRHTRAGNLLAIAILCVTGGIWAGYRLGSAQQAGAPVGAELPRITSCPASNPDQDVIEHAWTHKGVIIHRECLIVSKPIYASPRYSTARPTM